jgi:ubiquinone/menaquinone biosynthesis C-methylase UbiE
VNRQERYRQAYRRLKPGWDDSLTLYRAAVARHVGPETRVLDVGCGHADFLADVYARTPHAVGVDPDEAALQQNGTIERRVAGLADDLPFAGESFDVVACAWVIEHLAEPERALREIHRVLASGGRLIFLTPNAWNYNVWLIRLIPNRLHDCFTRRLYGRQERDT